MGAETEVEAEHVGSNSICVKLHVGSDGGGGAHSGCWGSGLATIAYFCTYFDWNGDAVNLTRARPGGGYPPLRFFADSEKTAARSAAKFAIAVQPKI